MILQLWHGSKDRIDRFDPSRSRDGGIHFGTETQARMRNSAVLHEVEVEIGRVRRCRDRGGDWKVRIQAARRAGYSAIVYLNRYEGLSAETIDELHREGRLSGLDEMSDAEFRKLVPTAKESYIVWEESRIRILRVEEACEYLPAEQNNGLEGP